MRRAASEGKPWGAKTSMQAWQKLYDDWQITAFCAIEIEWYLLHNNAPAPNDLRLKYLHQLTNACAELPLHSVSAETGVGQVEAALNHTDNMAKLLRDAATLRQKAHEVAQQMQLEACFLAKPFPQMHGNGLHIHVHLENASKQPIFWLEDNNPSPHLGFAIAGLLANMQRDLPIFAGSEPAMQRYASGFNAPINASWGFNNRTTALRLPDNVGHVTGLEAILEMRTNEMQPRRFKRIEHRVASSEADLATVLAAILSAIHHGINNQLPHPAPIFGNAHDASYGLKQLYIH